MAQAQSNTLLKKATGHYEYVYMCIRGCVFVWERGRQQFRKDAPLVTTRTRKQSCIHECTEINPTPLSVIFKNFKAKVKV